MEKIIKPGCYIYIMGICGTAMAALAGLLKEKGYIIKGSDSQTYPPMGDMLKRLDIEVNIGYFPVDIAENKPDLVIIGNVIRRDNPQAMYVMIENIPYMSFPEALNKFVIGNRKRYVVSGTHGKTTTTSMLISVLRAAGFDPGFMVGGILNGDNKGFHLGASDMFVLEGDEYDTAFFDKQPKFMHYYPDYLIITSLEFDHADIYRDVESIKEQFGKLIKIVPENGIIIYNNDWEHLNDIFKNTNRQFLTYGISKDARWSLDNVLINEGKMTFDVLRDNKLLDTFETYLSGKHNALNCLSVIALCYETGMDINHIKKGIFGAKGVKRRQEIKGIKHDITVIDDFAHHPTAISETLSSLKETYKDKRLVAIFEPRSNTTRRNIFQDIFPKSFTFAQKVIIKDVYEPGNIPQNELLDTKKLIDDMQKLHIDASLCKTTEEILVNLLPCLKKGDIVVAMSNGAFDNICERILEKL